MMNVGGVILESSIFARQNYLQPAPKLLARSDNCEHGGRIGAAPRGIKLRQIEIVAFGEELQLGQK